MAKLSLTDISSGYLSIAPYNANNTLLEAALENTLSRDGTTPNQMESNLDMNSARIVNLPDAVANQEPVTLAQAALLADVTTVLSQENVGAVLYPRTSAEVTASVTPTNYYYEPGNVLRYGTNTTPGTTDMTAAVQAALDVAEGDTDGIIKAYAPGGRYLIDTVYVPLGVTFYGDGAIETTGRHATTFIQHTNGNDVIRFKSLLGGSLYYWYGKLHSFAVFGDSSLSTGYGIAFRDASNNPVNLQDSSIIRDFAIRKCPQGGMEIPTGIFPCTIGPGKLLFNNGPGIKVTRTTVIQGVHFLDISGDGNNGGLLSFNLLNDGFSNVLITSLKSEMRLNADYSNAEHQTSAIVCTNCDGARIVINGANHISSIPDGGNFKKPGDFISLSGTQPQIMWSGVAIRVRGTDTGTDPKMIGGTGTASDALYTDSYGVFNAPLKLLQSTLQHFRSNNSDGDTTPSVANRNIMLITNSGSTTITDFDDGVDGQALHLTFADANTTVTDGGNLLLSGDYTSAANSTLTLLRVATGWRELSRSIQIGNVTYTPTNVTTDRAYDANATTTAELADVLGTLIADLQAKGVIQ